MIYANLTEDKIKEVVTNLFYHPEDDGKQWVIYCPPGSTFPEEFDKAMREAAKNFKYNEKI